MKGGAGRRGRRQYNHRGCTSDRAPSRADGVALPQEGTSVFQLRENVSFITAAPGYAWLNQLQGWGLGTVDPAKGEVKVKAYAA